MDFNKSAIEALKYTPDTPAAELTEEESFGKMVAKTLTRFNTRQKAIAQKKKKNDVLYEVEIEDIENTPTHSMFPGHFSGFYNQNNTSFNPVPSSDQHYTY